MRSANCGPTNIGVASDSHHVDNVILLGGTSSDSGYLHADAIDDVRKAVLMQGGGRASEKVSPRAGESSGKFFSMPGVLPPPGGEEPDIKESQKVRKGEDDQGGVPGVGSGVGGPSMEEGVPGSKESNVPEGGGLRMRHIQKYLVQKHTV